ncbi:MAG: hypothetical protein EA398_17970 [Deltaproteobacteria bacterium]|nr:MAG: hypothetical protein EA398_17970 [Deltaproteobacteria bacterium]
MLHSLLDRIAHTAIEHRLAVLGALAVLTLALAAQIPKVTADFTPSDLFASFEGQQALEDEVRQTFGAVDNVVLVLVQSDQPDGAFALPTLQLQHDLALQLRQLPGVERVDGLTVSPVPRLVPASGDAADGPAALALLPPVPQLRALLREAGIGRNEAPDAPDRSAPESAHEGPITPPDNPLQPATGPIVHGTTVTADEAEQLRSAIEDAPLLRGRIVSHDGRLAVVAVTMDRSITRNADIAALVDAVLHTVDRHEPPDGTRILLSGLPYVRHMVVERMQRDQSVLMPTAIAVCLLILLVAFRWWPALVLPMASVGAGAVWLVGGMAIAREPFNIINNIVPMMVIIIGISNAIHLLSRYGEECRQGHPRRSAAARAMIAMAVACFLTSFTTAVGFASLAIARTEILGRFGLTAAAGVMLVYVSTLLVLPASLTLVRKPGNRSLVAREGLLEQAVSHLAQLTARRAPLIATLAAATFLACLGSMALVRVDSAVLDQFDPEDQIHQTTRLVERELGGIRPLDVLLRLDHPELVTDARFVSWVEDFLQAARHEHGILSASAYAGLLREARVMTRRDPRARTGPVSSDELATLLDLVRSSGQGPLAGYLSADGTTMRIQLRVEDMGAQATIRLAERLDAQLNEQLATFDGVTHQLAGDAFTGSRGLDVVIRDLMGSLLLAFLIIFGFLGVLLRSLRLGLLSILPNVLPLALTLAWMVVRDIPLNTATAIIFSISIGLAVDGTIHMLVRFQEERRRGHGVEDALVRASRGTGRAIVLTCVSLVLGFGVMLLSAFVPVRRFGELIAVTVVGVLIGTLVVLPALITLFAPRRRGEEMPEPDGSPADA